MSSGSDTVGVVLEELGELAESVANVLGLTPAGAVVRVASLVLYDASETAHRIGALELSQIAERRAQGQAAGAGAAYESRQDFARRCVSCDATFRVCNMTKATSNGKPCCPECSHPGPHGKR